MPHKVFLVEDEVVTREGIRDKVDWQGCGFEFCGEAADGEMALALLETARPDVLITDIRMPFMDGLELCRILRERMPRLRIVILSGHDEFEYAQEAIKLGVTEYLLKPVTSQDMRAVLKKLASQLDREAREQEDLQRLRDQLEESRATLGERLLLRLVVGAISPAEAIAKGQALGMDLVAGCYLVIALRVELRTPAGPFDYQRCEQVQQAVSDLVEGNPNLLLLRKDLEELVLIVKGSTRESVERERDAFLARIRREVEGPECRLIVGVGGPKERITGIFQSFVEALVDTPEPAGEGEAGNVDGADRAELLRVDRAAVEDYLRSGVKEDFDGFYDSFTQPIGGTALQSPTIRDFIFMDLVLATARFVDELGVDIEQAIPELNQLEAVLGSIKTAGQLREQARRILGAALAFRDSQAISQYARIIQQAKEYIGRRYMDAEISLGEVAAQVNLSPSHFSTVFSRETARTFKEYLTEVRIKRAKELLRTTTLQCSEIAYQVGYGDPHYFSYAFRRNTGLSPTEFRWQVQGQAGQDQDPDEPGDGEPAAGGQDDQESARCG